MSLHISNSSRLALVTINDCFQLNVVTNDGGLPHDHSGQNVFQNGTMLNNPVNGKDELAYAV